MRDAFISRLTEHAWRRENIYLLTGDLGFSVFEDFALKYPDRFLNAGIAEANMMGVAAGLAMSGKKVFTYSIIPFTVIRCLEQIKLDVCYQKADVKIIGVGAGYAYGILGVTHMAVEDISVLRAYPNITILSPCDACETAACLDLAVRENGPFYLRLGKNKEPKLVRDADDARPGGSNMIVEGSDVAIFSTGAITGRAVRAAEMLKKKGIKSRVISVYSIKPVDERAVMKAVNDIGRIVTIEEHSTHGGLGSIVSDALAVSGKRFAFMKIGLPDNFCESVGSQEYLLDRAGLSPDAISANISGFLKKSKKVKA